MSFVESINNTSENYLNIDTTSTAIIDQVLNNDVPDLTPSDPRNLFSIMKKKRKELDLIVPRFKYDNYWVGPVPAKEVTFTNLNDNIDQKFLEDMCLKYGEIGEAKVYYHPKTRKHLGIGKILFKLTKSAKDCVLALNQTTKMGTIMNVFLDTLGQERTKLYEQATRDGNSKLCLTPNNNSNTANRVNSNNDLTVTCTTPTALATNNTAASFNDSFNKSDDDSQQLSQTPSIALDARRNQSLESRIAALFKIDLTETTNTTTEQTTTTPSPHQLPLFEHTTTPPHLATHMSPKPQQQKSFFNVSEIPLPPSPTSTPSPLSSVSKKLQPTYPIAVPTPASVPYTMPQQQTTYTSYMQNHPYYNYYSNYQHYQTNPAAHHVPMPAAASVQSSVCTGKLSHYDYYLPEAKCEISEREQVEKILNLIVAELKEIMRKDLNKRMIENFSFRAIEDWFSKEEAKSKILKFETKFKQETTPVLNTTTITPAPPPPPITPTAKIFLETTDVQMTTTLVTTPTQILNKPYIFQTQDSVSTASTTETQKLPSFKRQRQQTPPTSASSSSPPQKIQKQHTASANNNNKSNIRRSRSRSPKRQQYSRSRSRSRSDSLYKHNHNRNIYYNKNDSNKSYHRSDRESNRNRDYHNKNYPSSSSRYKQRSRSRSRSYNRDSASSKRTISNHTSTSKSYSSAQYHRRISPPSNNRHDSRNNYHNRHHSNSSSNNNNSNKRRIYSSSSSSSSTRSSSSNATPASRRNSRSESRNRRSTSGKNSFRKHHNGSSKRRSSSSVDSSSSRTSSSRRTSSASKSSQNQQKLINENEKKISPIIKKIDKQNGDDEVVPEKPLTPIQVQQINETDQVEKESEIKTEIKDQNIEYKQETEEKQEYEQVYEEIKPKNIDEDVTQTEKLLKETQKQRSNALSKHGYSIWKPSTNTETTQLSKPIKPYMDMDSMDDVTMTEETCLQLDSEMTEAQPVKKVELTEEQLKINRYLNEQLWEEHCYAKYLPWLCTTEDQIQMENEKSIAINNKNNAKIKKEDRVSRELVALLPPPDVVQTIKVQKIKFKERSEQEELNILKSYLLNGIDQEDIQYIKCAYDQLVNTSALLRNISWRDHFATFDYTPTSPPLHSLTKKQRYKLSQDSSSLNQTQSARTSGKYTKLTIDEKYKRLCVKKLTLNKKCTNVKNTTTTTSTSTTTTTTTSAADTNNREARSLQRRLVASFGDTDFHEMFKYNQLKLRKKPLKFAKSDIHDWGLFALDNIAAEEFVIEYVGETIRQCIADNREKRYNQQGIGSSYMFRIDSDTIVDATKCGNLSRFINHSCDPNCYAKIITIEGKKKIVIYSRREIKCGEEITYDYKFPIEDNKIPCFCGMVNCKGTLN